MWPARPDETEPLLREWGRRYPERVRLDSVRPWRHTAYALTVAEGEPDADGRPAALFAVPHAHEPAGTVACMEVLSQLLDGHRLDGSRSDLDREAILGETTLTFIPDANPDGRARSLEPWWNGARHSNEEFLKVAFGIDGRTGERFKRVDRWNLAEEAPARIGIVYEPIDATTYVEPNRDWDSSFFRLLRQQMARTRYDRFLDLHQTEFENSPHNCVILLPVLWEELPEAIRRQSLAWAEAITEAWGAIPGAVPQAPRTLGYTGQQRAYFEQRWGDLYRSLPCLTVEVQNNSRRTPPDLQRELGEVAIRVTVEQLRKAE